MFDPQMSDQDLLAAVAEHYRMSLGSSPAAQRWLESHQVSPEVAARFEVGFADRSLGLSIPRSNTPAGRRLRERLFGLGVLRSSGHETFRGTVTVPMTGDSGELVGVYGCRISQNLPAGTSREVWLAGCPGGLFNAVCLKAGDGPLVVASSIAVALSLLSAGLETVIAPGRPDGLDTEDLDRIGRHPNAVVVVTGRSGRDDELVAALEAAGVQTVRVSAGPVAGLPARVRSAVEAIEGRATIPGPVDGSSDDESAVDPARGPAPLPSPSPGGDVRVEAGGRSWRVRGLVRSAGFESMRANMTVTDTATGRFHIDTVDLYSARARAGYVAAAAAGLRVPVDELAAELGRVILAAEATADQAAESRRDEAGPAPMSDTDRDAALAWLQDPGLAEAVRADVAALGVVGEADNALLIYLALTSRLTMRPLSVMVQSTAAAGKSTLADTVASLIPDEARLAYSALTGQSLYYLGPDALAHKVLVVAEEHGAASAAYPMRLLLSAGRLAIASTGKDRQNGTLATRSYEVAGPVAALMTTTSLKVDDELASRLITITLGESVEQTRAIHAAQRVAYTPAGLAASKDREAILARHHHAQRLLQALPVVIPMADRLGFSDATTRSRRDHDKYLSLIAASALLHQYQRPHKTVETGRGKVTYVEATDQDVELADRLAAGVLVRDLTDLPPVTATLLVRLSDWSGDRSFTRRQARESLRLGDTQLKVHLARLVELEYVTVARKVGRVTYRLAWNPTTSSQAVQSGSGRPPVGGRSAPGRPPTECPSSQVNGHKSPSEGAPGVERTSDVETNGLRLRRGPVVDRGTR